MKNTKPGPITDSRLIDAALKILAENFNRENTWGNSVIFYLKGNNYKDSKTRQIFRLQKSFKKSKIAEFEYKDNQLIITPRPLCFEGHDWFEPKDGGHRFKFSAEQINKLDLNMREGVLKFILKDSSQFVSFDFRLGPSYGGKFICPFGRIVKEKNL